MARRKYDRESILALRHIGLTYRQIAAKIGMSHVQVGRILKEAEQEKRKDKQTKTRAKTAKQAGMKNYVQKYPQSKFHAETGNVIIEALEEGATFFAAGGRAGVNIRTLKKWLEKGRRADSPPELKAFVSDTQIAQAIASDRFGVVYAAIAEGTGRGNSQAVMSFLRRLDPEWKEAESKKDVETPEERREAGRIAEELLRIEESAKELRANESMWKEAPAVTENDI